MNQSNLKEFINDYLNDLKRESRKYILRMAGTTSLNKLEKLSAEGDNGGRTKIVAGAYVYFNAMEIISPIKHPHLSESLKWYKENLSGDNVFDPSYKTSKTLISKVKIKENKKIMKTELREEINKVVDEANISINYLSKKHSVAYCQMWEFFKNNNNNKMSLEKLLEIRKDLYNEI